MTSISKTLPVSERPLANLFYRYAFIFCGNYNIRSLIAAYPRDGVAASVAAQFHCENFFAAVADADLLLRMTLQINKE